MSVCSICRSNNTTKYFLLEKYQIHKCLDCKSHYLSPIPSKNILSAIYNNNYFIKELEKKYSLFSRQKQKTADSHINLLSKHVHPVGSRILEIGSGYGDFLFRSVQKNYKVTGVEYSKNSVKIINKKFNDVRIKVYSGELDSQKFKKNSFDALVFFDVMEHVPDLNLFMNSVKKFLKKNGIIILSVPSLSSLSARVLRKSWMEYKIEHLHYFNNSSLKKFLNKMNFEVIHLGPDKKNLSLEYIYEHFIKYPVPVLNFTFNILKFIIPKSLWKKSFNVTASGVIVVAKRSD